MRRTILCVTLKICFVIGTSSGCNVSQALPVADYGSDKPSGGADAGVSMDATPDCELKLQVEEIDRINRELEEIREQLKEQAKNGK